MRLHVGLLWGLVFPLLASSAPGTEPSPSNPEPPPARLQVLALGPEGKPLKGVFVQLVPEDLAGLQERGETDALGVTELEKPAPGNYRLLAFWQEKGQFLRYAWRDLTVTDDKEPARQELRFEEPRATLTGRVFGPDGAPLDGVVIEATQLYPSTPHDDVFLRNSAYPREGVDARGDPQGHFTLKLVRPGAYRLRVEYSQGHSEIVATTDAPSIDVTLGRACAATITGRVVDEKGRPVKAFKVGDTAVKHAQGRFRLSKGGCGFNVEAKGFAPRYITLPRPNPVDLTVPDVVLQRARVLTGKVVGPTGAPLPGVHVSANASQTGASPAMTNASGRFSLEPIPLAERTLLYARQGYEQVGRAIPLSHKGPLLVDLPSKGLPLEVRVLDKAGEPIPKARVGVENTTNQAVTTTDDSGRAVFGVAAGDYTVEVDAEPGRSVRERGVPKRFPNLGVQIPRPPDAAPLSVQATHGPGSLRLLLAKPSHYEDVFVVEGERPWPTLAKDLWQSVRYTLVADAQQDVWAQPNPPFIGYTALKDFTDLVPGTYTVFAYDVFHDGLGLRLFRKVIQVDDAQRALVHVRFDDADARTLP
ncbi:carboxypeptidase-like regulatory domain-containing protein [Corallococcus terminator]